MKDRSISNLPGQRIDSAARVLRKQILRETDPSAVLLPDIYNEFDEIDTNKLQIELYALSSIVIEQFWGYMKEKGIDTQPIPKIEQPDDTVYSSFSASCAAFLDAQQDVFITEAGKRIQASGRAKTIPDALLQRYFWAVAHIRVDNVPSMMDMVSLTSRVAEVAGRVYLRDVGAPPSRGQYLALLRHPDSVQGFLAECMTNSRFTLDPLLAKLEGHETMDTDDYTRTFKDEFFELQTDADGKKSIRLTAPVVADYRARLKEIADESATQGAPSPQALQCPVLYTPLFKEMSKWVIDQFEAFTEKA